MSEDTRTSIPVQPAPEVAAATNGHDNTMNIDSEEWAQLIRRRGALISKKNRQVLNDDERLELERLESIVDRTMERKFPPPSEWDEKIAAVESHLGGGNGQ